MHDLNVLENIAKALIRKSWMIAVAESCTGGLIAESLTHLSGSSAYFDRGFVTYSNEAKIECLAVPESIIQNHGAVSEACACAMVAGVLAHSHANVAISVTGIAGPHGGSLEKPVGTVFLAWQIREQSPIVKRYLFSGARQEIRESAKHEALKYLLEMIQSNE